MKDKPMDKSINTSTSTAVKTSIPVTQKISIGIMMAAAFIALLALVFGLYSETYQKPSKEPTGTICPDGRIATKCSCARIIRTPGSNYCCNNVYRTTACPSKPKLWLPFDGDLSDSSGNHNNASCSCTPPCPTCPTFTDGHADKATEYSGSQYLNVTSSESLNIAGAVTLALWLNPKDDASATWQRVIASPSSFTAPYVLSYIGSDKSLAISRSGSIPLTKKAVGLEEGKWQHVVAGYDASKNPFIYINGVEQNLVDYLDKPPGIASGSFRIGLRQDNVAGFNGLIDELRIYSRVLSQAEINQLAGVLCLPTDPPIDICSDGLDQDCIGGDEICGSCSNNNPITSRCLCGGLPYDSGYCCNNVQRGNACTAPVACEAVSPGRCFYLSPDGDDTNDGSLNSPWYHLGRADDTMRPGDYLYIMGGEYSMSTGSDCGNINIPCDAFRARAVHGGTETNHITIKPYGGSDIKATFTITGSSQDGAAFQIYRGADWFTLDGLYNNQIYLIFRAKEPTRLIEIGNEDDTQDNIVFEHQADHVRVAGVELDGRLANAAVSGYVPLLILRSDYATIEKSYIHDFWLPTGDISPGKCADTNVSCTADEIAQGAPDCASIATSKFFLIKDNRIERCNHGGIGVGGWWGSKNTGGKYGKITNNVIFPHYGGGIYVADGSDHNLVEGNLVAHVMETTTHTKEAIVVNGDFNTVRDNTTYAPLSRGISVQGYYLGGVCKSADKNLIYNNTVFGSSQSNGVLFWPNNDLAPGEPCNEDISVEDNLFANNIVYKSTGGATPPPDGPEIVLDIQHANFTHNWIAPDAAGVSPISTEWGGNRFQNNLLRRNGTYQSVIWYAPDTDVGGAGGQYSIAGLEAEAAAHGSDSWQGNIGGDPLLVSENPDDPDRKNDWWHLRSGSPAIDKGRPIPDTNGEYVRNMCGSGNTLGCTPDNGWNDLPFNGSAPDIGAYESPASAAQTQTTNVNSSNVNTNISLPVD